MNDTEPLLEEVRKIRSSIEGYKRYQKNTTVWIFVGLFVFLAVTLGAKYYVTQENKDGQAQQDVREQWTWTCVEKEMREGDYSKAIEKANYLLLKSPNYYPGLARLGQAHVMAGNHAEAFIAFQNAHDIFPSEKNLKNLEAARTLLTSTASTPNKP